MPLFYPMSDQIKKDYPHVTNQDWFLILFTSSKFETPGLQKPYEQSRFVEIVKHRRGLPSEEVIRRELLQALLSCPTPQSVDLLTMEIEKTCDKVERISEFILFNFPVLTHGWIEKFQKAIDNTDNALGGHLLTDTSTNELDITMLRDYHWPDAIEYLKYIKHLPAYIHFYGVTLREIASKLKKHELATSVNAKSRRVNTIAQEKHRRILNKYTLYLKKGYTESAAVQALVHDFRKEYSIDNAVDRRKQIMRIIRSDQNNKEQ